MNPDRIPGHVAIQLRARASLALGDLAESLASLRRTARAVDHAIDRLQPSSSPAELAQVAEAIAGQVEELGAHASNARASCASFAAWSSALGIDRGPS